MMKKLLFLIGSLITAAIPAAAQCFTAGTGLDGAYSATTNTTLAGGTYNYTTFNINAGVTVTVTGTQPLIIYCTGAATINGVLTANGGNGTDGVTFSSAGIGGVGVAGGANGGNGTYSSSLGPLAGVNGQGPGGAGNAGGGWSGGGGAGYAAVGGSSGGSSGGYGGPMYGTANIAGLEAGSGGGGGSGGYSCGAGGGGAGGGLIMISSAISITVGATGTISAKGGNGGSDGTGNCGGGGGGSGGSIILMSPAMTHNGAMTADGGIGGASNVPGNPYYGTGATGAPGRIRLDYNGVLTGTGTTSPAVGSHSAVGAIITLTSTVTNASCNGACDGAITVIPSGGTGPYSFLWMPMASTTSSISNLCAGCYTVTITDANGCTATETICITQPSAVVAAATATNATCNGACDGAISVSASGGSGPYTYLWSPIGNTTPTVNNLCAGCYTVIVTDANGCTDTEMVCITEPSAIVTTATVTHASCNGTCDGTISVSSSGGSGLYTYLWSPIGNTTPTVSNLCAGCYTVTVTDASGCIDTEVICITEPAALTATVTATNVSCNGICDGSAAITGLTGGTSPYSYQWCNGGTTPSVTNLCPGTCMVMIVDANGCMITHTVIITQPAPASVNALGNDTIICDPEITLPGCGATAQQHRA